MSAPGFYTLSATVTGGTAPYSYSWSMAGTQVNDTNFAQGIQITGPTNTPVVSLNPNSPLGPDQTAHGLVRCTVTDATGKKRVGTYWVSIGSTPV